MKVKFINGWFGGKLLAFSGIDGKTDYQNGLVGRTNFTDTGITIKVPCECKIIFDNFPPIVCKLCLDNFILKFEDNRIVKFAFVDAHHILIEGDCKIKDVPEAISVVRKDARVLIGSSCCFDESKIGLDIDDVIAKRRSWLESLKLPDGLADQRLLTVSGALSQMKGQICSAEGFIKHRWTTADRWPHRGMWLWDTAFHSIGLRHIDCQLAKETLQAMFDVQREDGFIPIGAFPDRNDHDLTQPPLLGLAAKFVYEKCNDIDWLREIYPKLIKYVEYDIKKYDVDGLGLVSWGWGRNDYRQRPSNASGMDNSPRFDKSFEFKAIDFNSYLASEYETLSAFAKILDKPEEAKEFSAKHDKLCELINKYMWSDEHKLYMDYDSEKGQQNILLSNAGFLPMLCGSASKKQAAEMIKHFGNPETFETTCMIPTIAKCEQSYNDKDMWRGPMWVNLNWLIMQGLKRYGYYDYANRIKKNTLEILEKYHQRYGTFFEFYDADDELPPFFLPRKGSLNPREWIHQVIMDYGWSACLYIDMIFSDCD